MSALPKLRPPRAYCTCCHATFRKGRAFLHRAFNSRATCPGIIRLAPNPSYWRVCVWCYATGSHVWRVCPYCRGDGWVPAGSIEAVRGAAVRR